MRYKGYTGKILKADLTTQTTESIPLPERLAEKYIGGVGIAAKLIHDSILLERDRLMQPILSF
jgi:aldehyde:ferredoxin oxidoreductase